MIIIIVFIKLPFLDELECELFYPGSAPLFFSERNTGRQSRIIIVVAIEYLYTFKTQSWNR
jgi:hypothetical protein